MKPPAPLARQVRNLARSCDMYCHGLGLRWVRSFQRDGCDSVLLALESGDCEFEFMQCRSRVIAPPPQPEGLVVLYIPSLHEWEFRCRRMSRAGFKPVRSIHPCWDAEGCTYQDADGYCTVLHHCDGSLIAPRTPAR